MNNTQYICECVNNCKEFEFIKELSDFYKVDYVHLCNFALDFYNYQRRNGLDKKGCKIMSLCRACEYAGSESEWMKP